MTETIKCERCNRKLNTFKTTIDWKTRKLHKSCWKLQQEELSIQIMIENYKRECGL